MKSWEWLKGRYRRHVYYKQTKHFRPVGLSPKLYQQHLQSNKFQVWGHTKEFWPFMSIGEVWIYDFSAVSSSQSYRRITRNLLTFHVNHIASFPTLYEALKYAYIMEATRVKVYQRFWFFWRRVFKPYNQEVLSA